MENELKQRNQRNRRRERAQRMQAQRESKVKDGDSGEDESPAREKPPRPPARRKKSKEPLGEEDIIDGFAIMAFRTYEDLEAAVKCVSSPRTNPLTLTNKPRLPLAAIGADATRNHPPNNVNHGITLLQDAGTSDDSGRASERLTGSSVAPRDPDSSRDRLSDASSRCSSGKGYICDSEGDDDKASPDNSRNASPRIHDVPMEEAAEGGALFRVTGAAGGGAKNELVARGGSGGALALSRAPVGGSASPAPAPLPQPAPSPAPAALPPPALPPPTFRADTPHRSTAANIPALDGQAATPLLPARPLAPEAPERPATTKVPTGARAAAESPTPAPPAPSPLFPSHPAYQAHAALPDYRHTNHETRTAPAQEPAAGAAPLDLHHAPRPPPPPAVSAVTSLPAQPQAATVPSSPRPFTHPQIGSSHITSNLNSSVHPYHSQTNMQKHSAQSLYGRPSHLAPFSVPNHVPNHVPPLPTSQSGAPHLNHTVNSHSTINHSNHIPSNPSSISSSISNHHHVPSTLISTSSTNTMSRDKNPAQTHLPPPTSLHSAIGHLDPPSNGVPKMPTPPVSSAHGEISRHPATNSEVPPVASVATSIVCNGYPPPTAYPPAMYPPLYAPYAPTLQNNPYLPPTAAAPRTTVDTRPSLSSPLIAPKTPKGIRPHTPGSTGASGPAPLHAPHAFSPKRHSPNRERDSYSSSISSLSRSSATTAISSTSTAPSAAAVNVAIQPVVPSLAPSLVPPSLAVTLAPPIPASQLAAPIATPLATPLPTPLASISTSLPTPLPTLGSSVAPLGSSIAPLGSSIAPLAGPLSAPLPTPLATPLAAPLATPTATPAAPTPTHLTHTLAPVPTVGSISSSAKPPAHWGVTRSTAAERPAGYPPAPLFATPMAPPNPNPFSAESLFQSSPGADMLRRELDNRFLAAAGGFQVRTEMHHHQHQHTHVHQHQQNAAQHPSHPAPPPQHAPQAPHPHPHPHHLYVPPPPHAPSLFKDMTKMPSHLYRTVPGLGYPYSSSLLHPPAPYVPPAPLSSYAPKPVVSTASDPATKPPPRTATKTGKWNAMHVRIAWEIYNHQQKEKASGNPGANDKDKLRAFPAPAPPLPPPAAPPPAPTYRSPYDLPPPYMPPHHPHLGVSPFARYGASAFPGAPPHFGLSPYARELALSSPLSGVHHPPSLAALHEAWRSSAVAAAAGMPGVRPSPVPVSMPSREQEERARREREERERDRERRERDERERRKQRELERSRQRSPLRNGEPKEERKEVPSLRPPPTLAPYPPPAAAWDPYRFDPLHHMRFTPLVEAAIRAEEDRAKMLSAYAHHQQMKSSGLLHRGLGPLGPLPPMQMPHGPMQPLDLLKKEEPR